jgi:ssDNA-binding Zn-finger/Zn-ribbon topoisomerase 1
MKKEDRPVTDEERQEIRDYYQKRIEDGEEFKEKDLKTFLESDLRVVKCVKCHKEQKFWKGDIFIGRGDGVICNPCSVEEQRQAFRTQDEAFKNSLSPEQKSRIETEMGTEVKNVEANVFMKKLKEKRDNAKTAKEKKKYQDLMDNLIEEME